MKVECEKRISNFKVKKRRSKTEEAPKISTSTDIALRPREMVVYEDVGAFEYSHLEQNIINQGKLIDETTHAINVVEIEINTAAVALGRRHPEKIRIIKTLMLEMERLLAGDTTPVTEEDLNKPDLTLAEKKAIGEAEEQKRLEQLLKEYKGDLQGACKKIYRKLSMSLHHDRTRDPNLRELFVMAKMFYDQLDLLQLNNLQKAVDTYVRGRNIPGQLRHMLLNNLNNLKASLTHLRQTLDRKRQTLDYRFTQLTKEGRWEEADQLYLALVSRKCGEMQRQVEALRAKHELRYRTRETTITSFTFRNK